MFTFAYTVVVSSNVNEAVFILTCLFGLFCCKSIMLHALMRLFQNKILGIFFPLRLTVTEP